jgi:hypothetical protein
VDAIFGWVRIPTGYNFLHRAKLFVSGKVRSFDLLRRSNRLPEFELISSHIVKLWRFCSLDEVLELSNRLISVNFDRKGVTVGGSSPSTRQYRVKRSSCSSATIK